MRLLTTSTMHADNLYSQKQSTWRPHCNCDDDIAATDQKVWCPPRKRFVRSFSVSSVYYAR